MQCVIQSADYGRPRVCARLFYVVAVNVVIDRSDEFFDAAESATM